MRTWLARIAFCNGNIAFVRMFSGLQLAETKKHWFKILRLKVVAKASKIQMIFFESWSHGKNVGQISCFMAFQEPIMGLRNKKN